MKIHRLNIPRAKQNIEKKVTCTIHVIVILYIEFQLAQEYNDNMLTRNASLK